MTIEQRFEQVLQQVEAGAHEHGCPLQTLVGMLAAIDRAECLHCIAIRVLADIRRLVDCWPADRPWPGEQVEALAATADGLLLDPSLGSCWAHRPGQTASGVGQQN